MRKHLKLLIIGLVGVFMNNIIAYANEIITIAASPVPHAEILRAIQPMLKKQGIELRITEFNDYVQPNLVVAQKQQDANFFQHVPYLNKFNSDHNLHLVSLVAVEIEPIGMYANHKQQLQVFVKSKQVHLLPHGLIIAVPNDVVNENRALVLLQLHGIIQLKSQSGLATIRDISANPYNAKVIELDAAILPRALISNQVDLAVINSNYALLSNLNPIADAIFIESKDSPYANVVAIRPDELTQPKMKALAQALHSPQLKQFIIKHYKGAIIPAF